MDRKEFEIAVEAAGEVHRLTMFLLQDPPGSLAAVAMREFDGAILPAWIQEAEDPERRSKIAARAVNQIDPTRHVQAATRQGPHPERDASRNIAALAAMWFLSERLGLRPVMRNRDKGGQAGTKGGSVCDAVGIAIGTGYKSAERIWTRRANIFRRNPLIIMTLRAELPSTALWGITLENY